MDNLPLQNAQLNPFYAYDAVEVEGEAFMSYHLPEEVLGLSRAAGIPSRFREANLHVKNASGDIADVCRKFVRSWPDGDHGMLLAGPTGLGKTHFACATVNELFRRWSLVMDVEVFYFNVNTNLPEVLDMRYFRRYDSYTMMLRKLTEYDLLIVDDLLHVSDHEWSKDILYRIYEARYASGLRTITTLNANITQSDDGSLDWGPVLDTFNEPFMRRLVETSGENLILMGYDD